MKKRLGQQPIEADVRWLRVLLGKCGLAQPGGWLPFINYQMLGGPISTPGWPFYGSISRSVRIKRWAQSVQVQTTNNSSNYWAMQLGKSGSSGSWVAIHTLYTNAISPDTWAALAFSLDHAVAYPGYAQLGIYVEKTGSPGNIYLPSPAVFVV